MALPGNVNIPYGETVLSDDGDWKVTRHLHEEIILHWEFEKADGLKIKIQYDEFPERHAEGLRDALAAIEAGECKSIDLTDASNTSFATTVDPAKNTTHLHFWRGSCGGDLEVTIPTAELGTIFVRDLVTAGTWPLSAALDQQMDPGHENAKDYLAGMGIGPPQPNAA